MRIFLRATAGLWFWVIGFSLLYGLHGIGCAQRWDAITLAGTSLLRWVMIAIWLLFVAGSAGTILWANRSVFGLERRPTIACAVAGFIGIVVTGFPVIVASACL